MEKELLHREEDLTSDNQLDAITIHLLIFKPWNPLEASKVIIPRKSVDKHNYKKSSLMNLLYEEPNEFIGNSYDDNFIVE